MKPAVGIDRLGRRLRIDVISCEDVRSPDADLAIAGETNAPRPDKDLPLQTRALRAGGLHSCLDLLPDARHAKEVVRTGVAQRVAQRLEALGEPDAGAEIETPV